MSVSRLNVIAQLSLLLGVVCAVIIGVSRRGGDFILGVLHILLETIFREQTHYIPFVRANTILQQLPKTIETATNKFNLKGRLVFYAVCTECKCTHKPTYKRGHQHPIYPKHCNNVPTAGGGKCGAILIERHDVGGLGVWRPILAFAYHDFKDYVCGLECRDDLRKHMDKVCDDTMKKFASGVPNDFEDIFSADFVREFKWTDGKLFVDRPHEEGRLLFSLCFDSFNVEGVRKRGANMSTGVIAMACLNLPIDIRYKPENLYIAGIIPGPHEPDVHQINHFIVPLVDDLKDAWDRGLVFTHSPNRIVRCAIACAVCDLVAARKLSCMAGVSANHMCTVCSCLGKSSRGRTDFDDWITRDPVSLRMAAQEYRDATSVDDQTKIFSDHGARWCELWRLPYWDPSKQVVADPMHCLLEGLAHRHFRRILGLTGKEAKAVVTAVPAFKFKFPELPDRTTEPHHPIFVEKSGEFLKKKEYGQVTQIYKILEAPVDNIEDFGKKLLAKNKPALTYACRALGLMPSDEGQTVEKVKLTKQFYVGLLKEWVSNLTRLQAV